jgi:GTP:adenosylcobinamide-phosphate guanylyltransferase
MAEVKVPAIVLAGGKTYGSLAAATGETWRALIRIAGRPIVQFLLDALRQAQSIGKVVLVGPDELDDAIPHSLRDARVPGGAGLAESLFSGLQYLDCSGPVLAVTADVPCITAAAIEDFVQASAACAADLCYSIIPRDVCDARFPGVHRTYVRVKEGSFTGGNATMLRAEAMMEKEDLIRQLYQARKSPLRLASLLGPRFVVGLLLGRAAIADIERRASQILGASARAVVSRYAELGFDVDKLDDLVTARKALGEQSKGRL